MRAVLMLFRHFGEGGSYGRARRITDAVCSSWPQIALVLAAVVFAVEAPGDIEVAILKILVVALAIFYAVRVVCGKAAAREPGKRRN